MSRCFEKWLTLLNNIPTASGSCKLLHRESSSETIWPRTWATCPRRTWYWIVRRVRANLKCICII